jgi:hypothetical protein
LNTKYSPEVNEKYPQKYLDNIERRIEQFKSRKPDTDWRASYNEPPPLRVEAKADRKYSQGNPTKSYKTSSIYIDVTLNHNLRLLVKDQVRILLLTLPALNFPETIKRT